MGQNNQKDQKGPKMTAAVMLVQNNQNNQKIWSPHISHTILKVRFFWDTLYNCDQCDYKATEKRTLKMHIESKHIKSLQEGLGIIVISVIKEQHKEAH